MEKRIKQIFNTTVSEYYDWVLEFDAENGHIKFFHISNFFLESGIIPANIDSFDELNKIFVEKLVVKDEKEVYLEQIQIPVILDELKNKGSYVRTVHIDTIAGIRAESLRIKQITPDESKFLVCLTDITMILDHDWMTDEYSRSGFLSRAGQLLREADHDTGLSIIYANIQGFKAVNDLLGTQSGDMVIFQERAVLVQELSPILIARLESDHFALITKTEYITEEKMEQLCHQCYVEGTKQLPILIRCGIYNINDPSKEVSHMLDQARLAEESIPAEHGIPYAVCNEQMSQDYVNQRVFVSELDKALEKGEFIPYYQPIVDTKTGEIVSAEALIRWNHFERGMIPPGMFIPVFEKEGLTTKLDSFMVNSVLNFNINRIKNGKRVVPCAVNLSRVDFYDTKLMGMLKQKLENQENVQDMLKLEITESAYAVLESDALAFLEEMRKLRLSFLLDDFGSGMSSLSTLELYDFDTIKLDMGFIRKIGKSPKAEAIIRHTIGMAHDMGAKVIAEGVEYEEQLDFLQAVDCDMIQGYYFYKPMPEEEFAKLL
ncbi:MAG: EAL domain-containing protein [Eubacterium sp.]|nr:EAL domain-containing protein [Eubacterium sp.]